jgi:hypothetical protein
MKLNLKENEYFEIYFKDDSAQIMFGHIYYNIKYGFVQIFKDSFETTSIKVVLDRLDSRCASYVKDIKQYMTENKYYFAIYKLKDDDITYFIKEEISGKKIDTKSSLFDLVENSILSNTASYEV